MRNEQLGIPPALVLCVVFLVACGNSGPWSEPAPPVVEARAPAPEAPARVGGRLVLVEATTDHVVYSVGEPVSVQRVYANVGDTPLRVTPAHWQGRVLGEVVITSAAGSRLYEPAATHLEEVLVEPGARTENRIHVELPGPGDYTIEVPPEYRVRGGDAECFRLRVRVLDRGEDRLVVEKAERLARVIEKEDPGCPTCWTQAQGDLKALGTAVVPELRRWLRKAEVAHLRAVAAKLLSGAEGTEVFDALAAGLGDPDDGVRTMCLDALGSFRKRETVDVVLPLLSDPETFVRVEAIETIASFDDPRVAPALRVALKDDDAYVRRWAAMHLAEDQNDAAGMGVLIHALETDAASEAFLVVPALEQITGRSFGKPTLPFSLSGFGAREEAENVNEKLAEQWLAWWDEEGRTRFGDD